MAKLLKWLPWLFVVVAVTAGSAALYGFIAAIETMALFACLVLLHPAMRR